MKAKEIKKVKMAPGRYGLWRKRDGAGDAGHMLLALRANPKKENGVEFVHGEVRLGFQIRVGSTYARSYQVQDWWQTTEVTKIKVLKRNKLRQPIKIEFKTLNSAYTLEST